jgi:hypothetical protein
MGKLEFKCNVVSWLLKNGIDVTDKKVRVYDTRHYGLEVRIYNEPMEFPNTRKSRRKMAEPTDEFNCTYGIHSRKISTYTHINEYDFKSESEKEFILDMLKNELR